MSTRENGIGRKQRESPNPRLQRTVTFSLHGTYDDHVHTGCYIVYPLVVAGGANPYSIFSLKLLSCRTHFYYLVPFSVLSPQFSVTAPTSTGCSCESLFSSQPYSMTFFHCAAMAHHTTTILRFVHMHA